MAGDDDGMDFAFNDPNAKAAFDAPAQAADQATQQAQQIQQQFDQGRARRNYIQQIAKGGNPSRGAIRTGTDGVP